MCGVTLPPQQIDMLRLCVCVCVSLPSAEAQLNVTMEDRVEVRRGEEAVISCLYSSDDDGVGGLIIEWFYVSLIRQFACLVLLKRTEKPLFLKQA